MRKLRILLAASEVVPFAKTGGMADVAGALPKELEALGHDVRVVLPFYRRVRTGGFQITSGGELPVEFAGRSEKFRIYQGTLGRGVVVYFVGKDEYYDRAHLYTPPGGDYLDNAERFIFFCKSVFPLLQSVGFKPDILHCNDWQTGLIPMYLRVTERSAPFFEKTRSLFTIHNLSFQGLFPGSYMALTGLPAELFSPKGIEFYGDINLLKAGIISADLINTVSKRYSLEIQTPTFGCGLEGVLAERREDLFGILNGVDYEQWSPQKDQYLAARYCLEDLSGKEVCKEDLMRQFSLEADARRPLAGFTSRLTPQKGCDILAKALGEMVELGVSVVLLGTGQERYERIFSQAAKRYPGRVGVKIGFDEALAHKIEAGSDLFLVPSKFEPCGLSQMYSLKYGTVPLVRATGGLDDTVTDFNSRTGQGNGFKFRDYSNKALIRKLKKALAVFENREAWLRLMHNGMSCDYSWRSSAVEYTKLYERCLRK